MYDTIYWIVIAISLYGIIYWIVIAISMFCCTGWVGCPPSLEKTTWRPYRMSPAVTGSSLRRRSLRSPPRPRTSSDDSWSGDLSMFAVLIWGLGLHLRVYFQASWCTIILHFFSTGREWQFTIVWIMPGWRYYRSFSFLNFLFN